MVNAVRKFAEELDRVNALPEQMAGVEIEAELFAIVEGLERSPRGHQVERDLRRMHLERIPHAALAEHVEDRIPAIGELPEALDDHRVGHRREGIEQMPD